MAPELFVFFEPCFRFELAFSTTECVRGGTEDPSFLLFALFDVDVSILVAPVVGELFEFAGVEPDTATARRVIDRDAVFYALVELCPACWTVQ